MDSDNRKAVQHYNRLAGFYDLLFSGYLSAVYKKISQAITVKNGDRILDLGCGTGEMLLRLSTSNPQAAEYVGLDVSPKMLGKARQKLAGILNITLRQAVIDNIPYPENYFDYIISSGVIHYLANPVAVLEEARRVLKPGGYIILVDMANDFLATRVAAKLKSLTDPAAIHFYTTSEIQKIMFETKFTPLSADLFRASIFGLFIVKAQKQVLANLAPID